MESGPEILAGVAPPEYRSHKMPHRRPRERLLIVTFLALLVGLAAYIFVPIIFSQSLENKTSGANPKITPNDIETTGLRTASIDSAKDSFAELSRFSGLTDYGVASHDACFSGAVAGSFAYSCRLRLTHFHGFDGDFKSKYFQLDRDLTEAGWTSDKAAVKAVISDYYEYGISQLPSPKYTRGKSVMTFSYLESTSPDGVRFEKSQLISLGKPDPIYNKQNFIATRDEVDPLWRRISADNRYVFAIAIEEEYFRK